MYLSTHQVHVLSRVMRTLAEPLSAYEIRKQLGCLMLELLGAQFYASYVWDEEAGRFSNGVHIDVDPENVRRYEIYYQYHDPITPLLRQRRDSVLVSEVMPQAQLKRTEFFNDLLSRDGAYWGINLYAWNDQENIGDMRIWRDRKHENFSRDDVQLLELVRPAFTAAVERCTRRHTHLAQTESARLHKIDCDETLSVLSARERQVAQLIGRGLADKEVAERLCISVTTVRTHIDRAFRKLRINNRVALARKLNT
ncbi:helix-turn-helix transcriptional regulator (plasmid) [Acidovorax sp. DW039]|uniref:helix-turn-helix transcriptional regulator n=1 Tax=Acidovorax sp. DW039 TaxID=3095606 RepID=UPI00308BAA08|nr:helix-turn-helix transcriptional regulator [Acidovorax sp. DW039]